MRDIRFRAWDRRNKEFKHFILDNSGWDFLDCPKFIQENTDLMQFTGIYDKNGMPIFEGDFVRCLTGGIITTGEVAWLGEKASYNFDFSYQSDFEVLGNVYENSYLLKG